MPPRISPLRFTRPLLLLLLVASGPLQAQTTSWSLDRAIAHAQDNNLQVRQGKLGLAGNDIDVQEARAAFLPNLNGSASHGYNWGQTIDPFTNQFATSRIRSNSMGVGSGITLFGGMANHLRLDQAEERRVAAEHDLESTRNDVALQVASAFLGLMFAEDALEIAALNVRTTETQVTRIRAFVDAGASPESDLLDLQARSPPTSPPKSPRKARRPRRLQLAQAMRLSLEDAEILAIERPDISGVGNLPTLPALDRVLESALTSFPEIKAGESRIRQQQIGLDLAKTTGMPRLSASWSYGSGFQAPHRNPSGIPPRGLHHRRDRDEPGTGPLQCPHLQRLPDAALQRPISSNVNQSLFFSLSVPIFNGWSVRNGVRRSEIGIEQTELALDQTRQTLQQSVERAHRDARNATQTLSAAERAEASAKLAFDNAQLRFEQGASTQVDYTQARNRYDSARLQALRARYDLIFRISILDFYSGRGLRFTL